MTYKEMEDYIKYMLTDTELVELCNDIYDYKHINGVLNKTSPLINLMENLEYKNIRDIENVVIEVASERLSKSVLLLLQSVPYKFFKTVS